MPFKLRAAPPAANPAVRVQSYALKAVSDRGLNRTISANRRNMPPLAGEVIRIQKYPCLFAAWFGWKSENTPFHADIRTAVRLSVPMVKSGCMRANRLLSPHPYGLIKVRVDRKAYGCPLV